jgi:hypothetical protein
VVTSNRLATTVAISVLIHAIVLWSLRAPETSGDRVSLIPDLLVHLEPEAEVEEEGDELPPPVASQASPMQAADVLETPRASEPVTQAPPAVDELPMSQEQTASVGESEIVTTTAESYREEEQSAESEEPAPVSVAIAIATPEQELLTRRIMQEVQKLSPTDAAQIRLSWQDGDRSYVAMMTSQPATGAMDIERAVVDIEAEENGKRRRTRMYVKRLAFSHFAQMVDRWDTEVQIHDDIVSGRFHSNSAIILAYDRKVAPLFLGKATTAARDFGFGQVVGRRKRADIFPQGFETRAGRVRFADRNQPLIFAEHLERADVHSPTGDIDITFHADGSYDWAKAGSDVRESRRLNPDVPTYILGEPNSTFHVRGTVRGKVLVYSPARIVIADDIVYASDPRSADSTDYLGLVSDRFVEIAGPRETGPGDLNIHAAVYAKRRFTVTHTYLRKTATMSIYGSLTAGSLSETEPRYATHVEFDPRFEQRRPPGFPQTDRFEIEKWDAQWEEM